MNSLSNALRRPFSFSKYIFQYTVMVADSSASDHKAKVFVSYVREDQGDVDRPANELSGYGIQVWLVCCPLITCK
jgi:hypothetical protein